MTPFEQQEELQSRIRSSEAAGLAILAALLFFGCVLGSACTWLVLTFVA